jgi:Outer membrane protein beta-barrel domain
VGGKQASARGRKPGPPGDEREVDIMQRERRWIGSVVMLVLSVAVGGAPALAAAEAPPPAQAKSHREPGKWEAGAYAIFSHHDIASTIENTKGAGIRVGYGFSKTGEVELDLDKGRGDSHTLPGVKVDVSTISVNYLRNYSPKARAALKPFLIFGAGVITVDNGADSKETELLRAGGGLRYLFGSRIAARFDISGLSWYGDKQVTARTRLYTFEAKLGISIFFGSPK